jgi:glutathione synthase/RimK-type ligase-like ATP-grasp enzyme
LKKIIVVNSTKNWTFEINNESVKVIDAKSYLTQSKYFEMRDVRVFNLCKNSKYQSTGYYVSLLAEARGQKVIPSITTIQDFNSQRLQKIFTDELENDVQQSLKNIKSDHFTLSVYFGKNTAKQHNKLAKNIYNLFQAPLLRAEFEFKSKWNLKSVKIISMLDISEDHRAFVNDAAAEYFSKKRYDSAKVIKTTYDLAILVNSKEVSPPSNPAAIQKMVDAAENLGFYVEIIDKNDFNRIPEFDALFIRETTSVNHITYRFSRRAHAEGLIVFDDPTSILRCTNKVYLAELLSKHKIPTPKTLIIHKDNVNEVEAYLGLPCVLKKPDSSFSQGVVKAKTSEELATHLADMLQSSDLIIGQEYLFTEYDWRVGIMNQEILYVCKYHMAKGHWQIYDWSIQEDENYGGVETIALENTPTTVLETSLKAANLIGDGLYGVDVKFHADKVYIIEINDNPSIDADFEDKILGDELYRKIMMEFKRRLDESKKMQGWKN